jgi:hypothetical protein
MLLPGGERDTSTWRNLGDRCRIQRARGLPCKAKHHANGEHEPPSKNLHEDVQPKDGINWFGEVLIGYRLVIMMPMSTRGPMDAGDNVGSGQHAAHHGGPLAGRGEATCGDGKILSKRGTSKLLATTQHIFAVISEPPTSKYDVALIYCPPCIYLYPVGAYKRLSPTREQSSLRRCCSAHRLPILRYERMYYMLSGIWEWVSSCDASLRYVDCLSARRIVSIC